MPAGRILFFVHYNEIRGESQEIFGIPVREFIGFRAFGKTPFFPDPLDSAAIVCYNAIIKVPANAKGDYLMEIQETTNRTHLAKDTEAFFRAMDRKKRMLSAVGIPLCWLAGAFLCALYTAHRGSPFFSRDALPFLLLLIVPFWPLRLHAPLLQKTYYATVEQIQKREERVIGGGAHAVKTGRNAGATLGIPPTRTFRVILRPDDEASGQPMQKTRTVVLPGDSFLPFAAGSRVFKAGAMRYPIPCDFDELPKVFCPVCGFDNEPGRERCRQCRARLGRRR